MSNTITKDSPWTKRFLAWILERFPPPGWILAFLIYGNAALLGRFLTSEGPLTVGGADLLGCLAVFCFFLMLRVFDEHKDYEGDMKTYPDRVLMRGLITLDQLKVVGAFCIFAQLSVSLWADKGFHCASMHWCLVMGWATLMAKEFFAGAWLKKRLTLYALSHMVIMPMMLLWLTQLAIGALPLPPAIGWIALLAFLNGAMFELTRKTRGPEEEREGVDSYTSVWGTSGAPLVIMIFAAVSLAVQLWFLLDVVRASALVWTPALIAVFVLFLYSLQTFRRAPSLNARKRNEAITALFILLGYLLLGGSVIAQRGIQWI